MSGDSGVKRFTDDQLQLQVTR